MNYDYDTATVDATPNLQPVVLHDNLAPVMAPTTATPEPAPVEKFRKIYGELEQLVVERQTWENTVYRVSNDALYAILQRCYALYQSTGDKDSAKLLRDAIASYCKLNGVSFKDSTHTMSKIVKCVFGVDRRRVSAYSIALRAAVAAQVKVEDLQTFIRTNGGVEQLRLAKSVTALTPKARAARGAEWVEQSTLATIDAAFFADKLDSGRAGQQLVLIATQNSDGTLSVNALIPNDAVVTSALAAFYTQQKAQRAAAAVEQSSASVDEKRAAAITAAAASTQQ